MSASRATVGATAAVAFVAIAEAMAAHQTLRLGLFLLSGCSLVYAGYELFSARKGGARRGSIEGGRGGDATVIGSGKAVGGRGGDVPYHDRDKEE